MTFKHFKTLILLFVGLFGLSIHAEDVSTSTSNELPKNTTSDGMEFGMGYHLVAPNSYSTIGTQSVFPSSMKSVPQTMVPQSGSLNQLLNEVKKDSLWWLSDEMNLNKFNNQSKDATELETTNLFECSDTQTEDDLIKLAQETDWSQCYAGRVSYTRDTHLTDKELLEKDYDICTCLRGSKFGPVKNMMSKNLLSNQSLKASAEVAHNLHKVAEQTYQSELDSVLNGVLFHAFALTENEDFTLAYANNLYKSDEKVQASLPDQNSGKPKFNLQYRPDVRLLGDEVPYPKGQCLSPRQFLLMKQVIQDKAIIEGLSKSPVDFDTWNFHKLQEEYQDLMKLPSAQKLESKEKISKIKSKLVYLNRNPLIKYTLGSDGNKDHKEKLFEIMKMMKDSQCSVIRNAVCSDKYTKRLAEFFRIGNVMDIVRKEARRDHDERAKKKLSGDLLSGEKKSLSQRRIIEEFTKAYNLPSPDNCEPGSPNAIECLDIFSAYCKMLDNYKNEIKNMPAEDPAIRDDLDDIIADDFNPDYNTNEEFQRMNRDYCQTPRKKFSMTGSKLATFDQFVDEYCKNKQGRRECKKDSSKDYAELRKKYFKEYPHVASKKIQGGKVIQALVNGSSMGGLSTRQKSAFTTKTNSDSDSFSLLDMYNKDFRENSTKVAASEEGTSLSGIAQGLNNLASNMNGQNEQSTVEEASMNYSNSMESSAVNKEVLEKVENMSDDRRQELLDDWEKDYQSLKEKKGENLSAADAAKESALKNEIATLKALLAQQQQLTQAQYKMLNDAIKSRNASSNNEVVKAEDKSDLSSRKQATFNASQKSDEDSSRAPASVKEAQFNTAGVGSGATNAPSLSKRSKPGSSGSSDSSADSVAREEAKLVNLRRHGDGSITIESVKNGSQLANAITVPVSDEQYKILQSNPTSLNLGQLEKNIPKDQLSKLEKNGEIIILLRNGSNPPFEVKVAKRNNKLVYSLTDKFGKEQAPVRRVFTREALEQQLKVQR